MWTCTSHIVCLSFTISHAIGQPIYQQLLVGQLGPIILYPVPKKIEYIPFTASNKGAFVWAVNRIRKIFYTMGRVWVGWKIQSNRKWFPLTVKYQAFKCKIIYTCILPSNDFRTQTPEKRERERARRESELDYTRSHHHPNPKSHRSCCTPASLRSHHRDRTPDHIAKIALPPLPSRSNSRRLNLGTPHADVSLRSPFTPAKPISPLQYPIHIPSNPSPFSSLF